MSEHDETFIRKVAIDWLRKLNQSIWKSDIVNYSRSLTLKEWQLIQVILKKYKLPVVMGVAGFMCNISIIEVIEPVYPGVSFEFGQILDLDSYHLPNFKTNKYRFEEGWNAFSPFSHSQENIQELTRIGLPLPKDKQYYEY